MRKKRDRFWKNYDGAYSVKVEIVESDNKSELDSLINACIQDRDVHDIKLATTVMPEGKVRYTAVILLKS